MRQSKKFITVVSIPYLASLGLAFSVAHSFMVLGFGDLLIFGITLFSGPLLLYFLLFKEYRHFAIAALHIFLAILIHPEFTVKEPLYWNTSEQFELLREIHASGHSWWVQADMAYDLARSLSANALLNYKTSTPFWYWVFPPSAVLAFWGVVFFFYFPKAAEGEDERPDSV